jgi:hypothetical protein
MSGVLGGSLEAGQTAFGDLEDEGGNSGQLVPFENKWNGIVQQVLFIEKKGLVAVVLATPHSVHKSCILYYETRPPFKLITATQLYPSVSRICLDQIGVLCAGKDGCIVGEGGNVWAGHEDEIVGIWSQERGKRLCGWTLDKKARLRSWVGFVYARLCIDSSAAAGRSWWRESLCLEMKFC